VRGGRTGSFPAFQKGTLGPKKECRLSEKLIDLFCMTQSAKRARGKNRVHQSLKTAISESKNGEKWKGALAGKGGGICEKLTWGEGRVINEKKNLLRPFEKKS